MWNYWQVVGLIAILLAAGWCNSAFAGPPPKLIFEDTFLGTSDELRANDIFSAGCHADSCKWVVLEARTSSIAPDVCLYRSNFGAAPDGGLRVTVKRGNYSVPNDGGGTQNCEYSSAFLQSRQSFTYGYFEITAKVPTGRGMLPALWLYTQGKSGEIDLIDGRGGTTKFAGNIFYWRDNPVTIVQGVLDPVANTVMPTIARGGFGPAPQQHSNYAAGFGLPTPAKSLQDEYHTYGVNWQPSGITFFFDRQAYFHTNRTLTDPMMIMIDFELATRSVDPNDFPQFLDVRSVRVYDHAPDDLRPSNGMPMLIVRSAKQGTFDMPSNKVFAWAGAAKVPYTGPPIPRELRVTERTSTSLSLSWVRGGEASRRYEIAYAEGTIAPDCGNARQIGNGTSFKLDGLKPGSPYVISVCSLDARGGKSFPQIINARTPSTDLEPQ